MWVITSLEGIHEPSNSYYRPTNLDTFLTSFHVYLNLYPLGVLPYPGNYQYRLYLVDLTSIFGYLVFHFGLVIL